MKAVNLPRVIINPSKIIHNYQVIQRRCQKAGISLTTVIKGLAGDIELIRCLTENGVGWVGDSRLENLLACRQISGLKTMLLRLPALSRITEVCELADISLNTEIQTLQALNSQRLNDSKPHEVFFMVDLGDRREGVMEEQLSDLAKVCRGLKNIRVTGVGANFSCFAGIKPSKDKLGKLVQLASFLKEEYRLPINYVSGGNSSSLPMLYQKAIYPGVNHLRIGEGILLGRETLDGTLLPDLYHDSVIVEAEVLQVQWKPPAEGEIGLNAFGREPNLPKLDAGFRLLLNIGHQDTPLEGLTPLDPELTILGGSSDYLVMTSARKVKVGEVISFIPNYWSLLALMTSRYVGKMYVW